MPLTALARVSIGLFTISLAFPIVASSFVTRPLPGWAGMADVVIAAAFFASIAFTVARAKSRVADQDRLAALRMNQAIVGIIPILLAAYFVVGPRVNWTVLVIGVAWRTWLLLYSTPYLVAALRSDEAGSVAGA